MRRECHVALLLEGNTKGELRKCEERGPQRFPMEGRQEPTSGRQYINYLACLNVQLQ